MKLVYLTVFHPCRPREQFIEPEIAELVARGHDVTIVPVRPGRDCSASAATVAAMAPLSIACMRALLLELAWRPLRLLRAIIAILRTSPANALRNLAVLPKACWVADIVRRQRADCVHAQWATTPGTVAMVVGALTDTPWSITVHRHDVLANNLLAAKVGGSRFVRFPSAAALADAQAIAGPLPSDRLLLAHMGVTVPPDVRRPEAGEGPAVLICPAALTPRKGQRLLIDAMNQLRDTDIELWLAGDGEDRGELERLVAEQGLTERVRFLGLLGHDELLNLYATGMVWAAALATQHEGIPFALMEAMAHGVPVVATPVGGIPELLAESAGLLVPEDDRGAVTDALRRLRTDRALCDELSHRGRARIIDQFELGATVSELEAALLR